MTTEHTTTTTRIDNGRYRQILRFFGGMIAHFILWDIVGGRIPLLRHWVRRSRSHRFRQWARRFRQMAIHMGGVMIKLGQFLSARVDVLPPEITDELMGLQDEVPPEDPQRILAVLRQELGDVNAYFAHVEEAPVAAASLGQVHRAWLLPSDPVAELGQAVMVKVQRPFIEHIVHTDLTALRVVARWIMRYGPIRRRANVPALMEEFAETLWQELDYEAEAEHAERFAEMYANSDQVYIPAVYRQHSTGRVIVLEDVTGIKITDLEGMQAAQIDPVTVADVVLRTYFDQIFKEGFFHADPHPGNLFVRPREDLPWQPEDGPRPFWLVFVDFGMVGRVPDMMLENLRQVLVSVTQRDARRLTEAYDNLGFFLPEADLERIIEVQSIVLNRIWGRKLLELARPDPEEMQEMWQEFRDVLFGFPFQIPQNFIYLGRAMGMVSGLVSQLNPEINPWYYIELYGEELLQEQVVREFTLETAVDLLRPYLSTPAQLRRLLDLVENGRLRVKTSPDRETMRRLERLERRLTWLNWSLLSAASLISITLWRLFNRENDKKE
ncbi:MAG: AarF/ABC1/UbiB kinase family protein [Chloroflexi bacterium]|nr:MAG: AarF/ABC1/UbiB kinase family protein [Chloroflexota bacterium]